MSGFTGFVSFERDISEDKKILENMSLKLKKKGPDREDYYTDRQICLSQRNVFVDNEKNMHPICVKYDDITYALAYNGKIYNKKEIKEELIDKGYEFNGNSDEEVILKAFIHFGSAVLKRLNGVFSFAIWNSKKQELYLVRDHFGIKPLYYTITNNTIIFSTEIKSIIEHPEVEVVLNNVGISEMLGLRPSTYSRFYSI